MGCCSGGYCAKCKGMWKALTGALVLLNWYVWPKWTGVDGWVVFFGALMVLGGIVKAAKPTCGCCAETCEVETKKGKKK